MINNSDVPDGDFIITVSFHHPFGTIMKLNDCEKVLNMAAVRLILRGSINRFISDVTL